MQEQPGCQTCFTYNDAFGATKHTAQLRNIWNQWETHIIKAHPDYVSAQTEDDKPIRLVIAAQIKEALSEGDILYVVK